jgi:hypothetical protein
MSKRPRRLLSRVLFHISVTGNLVMIIRLGKPLPVSSSDLTQGKYSSEIPSHGEEPLYLVLLRVGFTALHVTMECRELLPHAFTLTCAYACGFLSVALSLGLPPLDVIQHPALWSSDFPPAIKRPPAIICSTLTPQHEDGTQHGRTISLPGLQVQSF